MAEYAGRVRRLGASTLMVNYLADTELGDGSFGGAWMVDAMGEVQASLPLGKVGLLIVDLG